MGENTKIQWADNTFNGWIGCTKVSPACDHCYAEELATRYGWAEWGVGKPRHRTSPENWKKPLAWNRKAEKLGIRYRVFANSLSDVFDVEVPDAWRDDLMLLIEATPNLDWLLLTKRPRVMREYFERRGSVPENVWAGTTVENQTMAELRLPELLRVPAANRFLSCEPLLGPLDLIHIPLTKPDEHSVFRTINALTGVRGHGSKFGFTETTDPIQPHIGWVIVGGESGKDVRPIEQDWIRSLRGQCEGSGAAFFFKQWSGRNPKTLGRLLDGREWNEIPHPERRA
jgi:protein gp37